MTRTEQARIAGHRAALMYTSRLEHGYEADADLIENPHTVGSPEWAAWNDGYTETPL